MRRCRAQRSLPHRTRGFTLIELFGCITITLLLLALLAPMYLSEHKNNPRAMSASCMSKEKQIGLALIGYTQDNDGKFPSGSVAASTALRLPSKSGAIGQPALKPGRSRGQGIGWAGCLSPYLKSESILKCPCDETKAAVGANAVKLVPISYAMNQWLAAQSGEKLSRAETTVLFFECLGPKVNITSPTEAGSVTFSPVGDGYSNPETGVPYPGDAWDTPTGAQDMIVNDRGPFARHDPDGANGGASMWLLADGHVKFLRFDSVSVGKQPVSQSKLGTAYTASFNPTP